MPSPFSDRTRPTLDTNFFDWHGSTLLSSQPTTSVSKSSNLGLEVGAPTILVIVAISAICFVFLVKRVMDHRRQAARDAVTNRSLENGIPRIDLPTVSAYGRYLNSLRISGSQSTQRVNTNHHIANTTADLPPSYNMATKYSTTSALSSEFSNNGYAAASESCLVLPPSYAEATRDLSSCPEFVQESSGTEQQTDEVQEAGNQA